MSKLREKLALYDLDTASKLAKALGITRQWAHQILAGQLSVSNAKRIAELVDEPWFVVYEWKDTDGKQSNRRRG